MHIIIDATTTQTKPFSGIGQYTKNLVTEMIRTYTEIDFTLFLYKDKTTIPDSVLELSNVNVVSLGEKLNKALELFMYDLKLRPALRYMLENHNDLFYFCPYFLNGFPTKNMKVVITIHDFALAEFNYYSDRGGIYNLIRKNQYWYHMDRTSKADAIVTVSENTALDYMRYYPNYDTESIYPVMLGIEMDEKEVDIDQFLPNDWQERGYFIYMGGGIQKSKNTEGVIKAYSKYLERYTDETGSSFEDAPYLIIAGKIFTNKTFPQSVAIRELIEGLGLQSNVHFSGYYDDVSKYSLLENSIAFLHLSLFEGFGIAVAEAMRAGKPVIVHNGTSYPEVVGDAGYLVDGSDPDKVADLMLEIQSDKESAKALGLKARERSFMFDWKKTAKETMDVFKELDGVI